MYPARSLAAVPSESATEDGHAGKYGGDGAARRGSGGGGAVITWNDTVCRGMVAEGKASRVIIGLLHGVRA